MSVSQTFTSATSTCRSSEPGARPSCIFSQILKRDVLRGRIEFGERLDVVQKHVIEAVGDGAQQALKLDEIGQQPAWSSFSPRSVT